MFLTSHASGSAGQAIFNGFTVASGSTPPSLASSYEARPPGTRWPAVLW